jgi:hypothetical protein
MVKYNGAIEYIILKNKNKYILFFLDDHQPEKYCKIPSKNIEELFNYFLNMDNSTTFIFEELLDNQNHISLFPNVPHLVKYLEFYKKYEKTNNFFPVDIRIIFDNTDLSDIFTNLDILFGPNIINSNNLIYMIKTHLEKTCAMSYKFLNYYQKLKNNYYILKKTINNNIELMDIIKKNKNQLSNTCIDLNYPWLSEININEDNILEILETFYSSLLELYAISYVEYTQSKYVILYLGATHCISIFNILNKYFDYSIIRNFLNYDLKKMKYFKLENLEKLTTSCIDL